MWFVIISHRHRFIFIKTMKTGSSSVEAYLSGMTGDGDVVTPIWPPIEGHEAKNYKGMFNFVEELRAGETVSWWETGKDCIRRRKFYNHIPARLVKCRAGPEVWEEYFTFCVERNPWDKCVSFYEMVRATKEPGLGFSGYLGRGFLPVNVGLYSDSTGVVLVDKVLRYEKLGADLSEVCEMIGLPFSGLDIRAKAGYRRARGYREYYGRRERNLVARKFEAEIAMHGYEF